jgi:hypothetical protein
MARSEPMFDRAAFVEELANQIADHLRGRAPEFERHRLGAVALDAHPWHKGTGLSVLVETDTYRKWDLGDWEHQEFADLDGPPMMLRAYDELQNPDAEGSSRYAPFFRACAEALCRPVVRNALKLYTLEPDFELFVGDPDDPNDVNYCEEFTGVDRKTRKAKTEIVDDLDEAMKDPLSVLVLKYWYHEKLTKPDGERISQLVNLEALYLHSMGLKTLPRCLLSLSKLRELHLDYNRLTRLTGLGSLTGLNLLSLRDNGALTSAMAGEIAALPSLRQLWIGHCGLAEVPPAIEKLHALEELFLFGNPLTVIPDWVPALPNLKRLGLVDSADDTTKQRFRKRHPHLEIW